MCTDADRTRSRRIYVDSRLHYMLQLSFNEPFFTRGDFPPVVENGSTPIVLQNPWVNGTNATPFDQRTSLWLRSRDTDWNVRL